MQHATAKIMDLVYLILFIMLSIIIFPSYKMQSGHIRMTVSLSWETPREYKHSMCEFIGPSEFPALPMGIAGRK